MSERPDGLSDDELAMRLKSEMDSIPPRLAMRLEHLAAAGLHVARRRVTPLWLEVAPQILGAAFVLGFFVVALLRLHTLAAAGAWLSTTPMVTRVSPASSSILSALMLPLAVLLWTEALRGAPTVQRWLDRRR
jgi:hypothetical protein